MTGKLRLLLGSAFPVEAEGWLVHSKETRKR
jgi:hypothetical protein